MKTDKELAEIGIAAINSLGPRDSLSILFASVVAAAVRAETPWGALGETQEAWMARQQTNEAATLTARLAALEWRPVSVKPTQEDIVVQSVEVGWLSEMGNFVVRSMMAADFPWDTGTPATHWRPFSPPPAPSKEEAERARASTTKVQ